MSKFQTWEELRKDLNITPEQELEIQLEEDIIKATIEVRKRKKMSQKELSEKTGMKQPSIARVESHARSPQVSTLIRMLLPLGYTLKVVPIQTKELKKK